MTLSARASLAAALLSLVASCSPVSAATTSIELPEAAMTSAGVFDSTDRLVRTLWSGRRQPAGRLAIEWDGRDDDGAAVPDTGTYLARVLAHNVRYIWEGVIGNTSRDMTGTQLHRALGPINDMAIDSRGNAFYVVGYNEQQPAIHRFQSRDPQRQMSLAHDDYRRVFRYAATDGTLSYFANVGLAAEPGSALREPATFVLALRLSDGTEHEFFHGYPERSGMAGNHWKSVIDRESVDLASEGQFQNSATGLAVQQRGNKLFVAHGRQNEVRVFDKTDGRHLAQIPVSQPGDMDVAPDDSLWVLCRTPGKPFIARFVEHDGSWNLVARISEGLVYPLAIGVSPVDGTLLVADSGTEQLLAFDESGRSIWTLGRKEGYRSGGPGVTNERFWLSAGPTYVAFANDGSFWFGDPGNLRNLHFSAQRKYLGQIMYLPATRVTAVDPHNPARVFRHFLEFAVDYSRPIGESWTLTGNWGAGLDSHYFGEFDGFESIYTLNNRRTYGVVRRPGTRIKEVFELTSAGLRPTGAIVRNEERLYGDGSLRSHLLRLGTLSVYRRKLAAFDETGNPQWDSPEVIGGVSSLSKRDPYYHDVPEVPPVNGASYPDTRSGLIVAFSPGISSGFHLGGIQPGRDGWLWRASASGSWEVDREGTPLSPQGTYELGRGVQYPGNLVVTAGQHIIYGYHGEGWNGGQANQWMHYLENGLFVGQFGRPVYPASNRNGALPESAGNAFSPALVSVNGRYYLWHNDESVHGGIHRWRIDGIQAARVLEAAIDTYP